MLTIVPVIVNKCLLNKINKQKLSTGLFTQAAEFTGEKIINAFVKPR